MGGETDRKDGGAPDAGAPQAPPVDFSSFILSLAAAALVDLGEMEDPQSGERRARPEMARHTIDLMAVLKDKTAGNLSEAEGALLDRMLADLRMRFVKSKERPEGRAPRMEDRKA